jgi:hypothetical protein
MLFGGVGQVHRASCDASENCAWHGVMLVEQDEQMVIAVLNHLAFDPGSSSLLLLELASDRCGELGIVSDRGVQVDPATRRDVDRSGC